MAATRDAFTTGKDDGDLRRRNIQTYEKANGGMVYKIEAEDTKKLQKQESNLIAFLDEWEFLIAPLIFTALAFFTRMWRIGLSPIVTWDEAHFGKFGSHYLKREFYFDVHPPLGKMLVGLSGYLAGYNGSFEFKSGERYPEELNYTSMRVFNAFFGAVCIPLAYFTARELNFKRPTVWLVTLMVLCENSYATISRFILLDSMLLCFTFTTTLCWARFHRIQKESFSPEWFFWLFLTGLSIGCVCSVKWVGLFCTALVGLYTVEDLWNKFGDLKMPKVELASHVAARVVGLIVVPMLVYMFSFYLHFLILENSGPGDAQMSSLFQANLRGTEVGKNSPLEVAYGSKATLKNMGYGGGLLHSHVQTYPEGSNQQQVTCYHHKDANNDWFFYPNRDHMDFDPETADVKLVANNDVIRLIHAQTGRNLHSHSVAAPVTKTDNEVSCYGNTTIGDDKDHWTVEVVNDAVSSDYSKIRTLTTAFRLRHTVLGCYLRAGNVNLPQWGFKQIETTCVKENKPKDVYTHWNVEAHWNDKLPPGEAKNYKSPFLRDFIHLNVAMMTSNNALVPDPDKQDDLASQFWQWPILNVGLRMCSWDDNTVKYFLLGNPIVYWGSAASLGVIGLLILWYLIRWQRGYEELSQHDIDFIHYSAIYPVVGWFLHYLPFVAMARVTYVHHYYPALYFAILSAGFVVDWTTQKLAKRVRWSVYFVLYATVIGLFVLFKDIVFGMQGSNQQWRYLKWFDSWRILWLVGSASQTLPTQRPLSQNNHKRRKSSDHPFLPSSPSVDRAASGQPYITGTIAPSRSRADPIIHLRTLSSHIRSSLDDQHSTALLSESEKQPTQEGSRRPSYSSNDDSDDFSLWSDTGDIAEQLAEEEDPLRIQLQPLTNEGRTIDGHGGRNKKRVHYHDQGHLERKTTHPGIDKEAIRIPEPAQRPISVFEKYFAYIMAPGDRETARRRGLVGKPLLFLTSVFVSLGVFLFGYDQGVMSGIITGSFFLDYFNRPSRAEIGTMVAILEIGAFISSLMVGRIGDMIGRRRTIMYGSIVFFVGGACQTFATGMPMMLLGRILAGLGVGALSTIVPVYQSEISPPHNRGKLACIEFTGNVAGYAASVWTDYFCSYIQSHYAWRLPLLLQCVMGALLGFGSLVICESPRWLLDNDHDEEGIVVIANLYGGGDIHNEKARQEYREIKMNVLMQRQEGERSYGDMFKRYHKRVLIAMSAQALAQLNGINVISYYAPLVFESAGWVGRDAILMTGINAFTYLGSTVPPWYLVDRWGRRPILLSGAVAMIISLSLVSYFIFIDVHYTPTMVVIFVMVYNAAFGASWGPIPWLYPPEILPLSIRAKGASLSTASNWAFNWLVGEVTPVLQAAIKWRLYLVHAFFCAVSFVVVYFLYPETANVRLEDMNLLFGDATTAMPTPATQAERGSLFGIGSPDSIDIRRNMNQPSAFSADAAIPGLDINPPSIEYGENGRPINDRGRRKDSEAGEGLGSWIGRMVSRSRKDSRTESRGGYGRVGQDEH